MSTAVLLETAAPVAVSIDALLSEVRAMGIRIPRTVEVRDYVKRFPDILPVVRQACELTVADFAGKASLSLAVYVDPEIDDSYLVLYVQQGGYDAAVSEVIENIFARYAEGMIPSTGWMMVMQEFRGGAQRD